ncbi:FAD:protein FMN transferase [Fulvivirgaceae bacterium BMA10]|uniref:FAD:protein FMN transferase n=1 Tax=Splendidivirga corallicola TaxID=3051826 RepID=A0ABT8KMC2_9BACT|nr:FAD:protein FMN transferase [Fulvivirgaceae bacterium BMA10]
MKILQKKRIYPIVLILVMFAIWKYRQSQPSQNFALTGTTMGTIAYNIKYIDPEGRNFKTGIDSLLTAFNQSLSTYISDSEISKFNNNTLLKFETDLFYPVLKKSKEVFNKTQGAFDPTIMPLVNAWGFGPDKAAVPDSTKVDSLRNLVGFNHLFFDEVSVCKLKKGLQLDFSAIAKGYAVDLVHDYLRNNGIENIFVEIGGEVAARGKGPHGKVWTIGIEDPTKNEFERTLFTAVELENQAIATSGNYRNIRIVDGKKFAHTISPYTGFPIQQSLLSASVFAKDCMTADAYATAFMVLGMDKTKDILSQEKGIDAYLIFTNENGELEHFATENIRPHILK